MWRGLIYLLATSHPQASSIFKYLSVAMTKLLGSHFPYLGRPPATEASCMWFTCLNDPSTNSVLIFKISIPYWDSYPATRIIFLSETNSVKSEYRKQMCRYLFVGDGGSLIGWGNIWRHFVLAYKLFWLCVYTTNLLASWLISEYAATDKLLSAKNSSKLLSRNRLERRNSQCY